MRISDGSLIKKVMFKFGQSLGNPPQIHKFHRAFGQWRGGGENQMERTAPDFGPQE